MGRNRSFDEAVVVEQAAEVFLRSGYEGTSIEELVAATGLHRGSLYQAFASKRGLFLTCPRAAVDRRPARDSTADLVLVALLELAPRDREVREVLQHHLGSRRVTAADLGHRLVERGGLTLGKGSR